MISSFRCNTIPFSLALLVAGIGLSCQPDTRANEAAASANAGSTAAEGTELRKSPMAIAAITLPGGAYVKVVYSSPRKRGRQLFGSLVPYGEVWRTGANEATEITVTRPVMIADRRLEAGTYALFTIPRKEWWTVILNGTLGQWGAYEYDASTDVMRFDVPVQPTEKVHEAFTITIDGEKNHATIKLEWETTSISIPLRPI